MWTSVSPWGTPLLSVTSLLSPPPRPPRPPRLPPYHRSPCHLPPPLPPSAPAPLPPPGAADHGVPLAAGGGEHGTAVQVDPLKPMLKPPGTKRLKVKCGYNAFNFCFQIQLAPLEHGVHAGAPLRRGQELTLVHFSAVNLSILCPIPLNLSLLCCPCKQLTRGCGPKVLKLSSNAGNVSRRSSS
jgi:hypothetical protein